MGSSFWEDVVKLVVPVGFIMLGLTCLSITGIATFGTVRLVREAIIRDHKFYFMSDIVGGAVWVCGSLGFIIFALLCFKRSIIWFRRLTQSSSSPSTDDA